MVGLSAFGSFVNDMYVPSLPSMKTFFGCSTPTVQLGLTFGMIGLGLGQILLGPLSDHYGRKKVLVGSVSLFVLAAIASIFSPTIHVFLGFRLIQGIGASGGYFLARTIPADVYGGRQLAKTMAVIGAINGFAPACAPVLGGFIADWFDWKGVFISLAVIGMILIAFSPRLKETLPPERRTQGSLLASFADYKPLLKNRAFMTHVMLKGTGLGLLFAYISSAPFIMQTHFGYSQTAFGIIMGLNAIPTALGAMLALKFKPLKCAALIGSLILAATVTAEVFVLYLTDSFWAYELLLLPMLLGLGMIFTVGNTLAMNEGRQHAGTASAVLGVMGYVFGAIVSPLVGMGNIMHSSAIVFAAVTVLILITALCSRRLAPDLQ